MATTWTDVENVDASLAAVPPSVQAAILERAGLGVNAAQLGTLYDTALRFLAAHHGVLYLRAVGGGAGAGAAGPVTSETVGPVSRAYGASSSGGGAFSPYDSTEWGRQFLATIRLAPNCALGLVV